MPSIVLEQIIELYTLQLTQIKESRDLEHNSQVLQVYVTNNLWREESRSEASRRTGLEVGGGRESVALRAAGVAGDGGRTAWAANSTHA
jgi:hypothetical protein